PFTLACLLSIHWISRYPLTIPLPLPPLPTLFPYTTLFRAPRGRRPERLFYRTGGTRMDAQRTRHHQPHRDDPEPVDRILDHRAVRRTTGVGPDHLVRDRVPPAQERQSPAGTAALPPPAGTALHLRADRDGGRAVLLRRHHPGGHHQPGRRAGRERHRVRPPVDLG